MPVVAGHVYNSMIHYFVVKVISRTRITLPGLKSSCKVDRSTAIVSSHPLVRAEFFPKTVPLHITAILPLDLQEKVEFCFRSNRRAKVFWEEGTYCIIAPTCSASQLKHQPG